MVLSLLSNQKLGGFMSLVANLTVFMCLSIIGIGTVGARNADPREDDIRYHTLDSVEVREVSKNKSNQEFYNTVYRKSYSGIGFPAPGQPTPGLPGLPGFPGFPGLPGTTPGLPTNGQLDPVERTGKVISLAKDLVALGEDVYKLVVKGRPTITTNYAPISVIPRLNGQPVDIMETENWKIPVKRTYEVLYKNLFRMHVVKFRYSVIYSYGGTYNETGAYLTAVQIIPESMNVLFGYDFTATMKLGGIQNNGTRQNPIAGATLLLEYTVRTILMANTEVRTVFVTGQGGYKKY